jgi:hypothetical protein
MKHIMIRIVTDDYETWLRAHYDYVHMRKRYGMTDGPIYRDIEDPNVVLFHIMTEDLPLAMEWFNTETCRVAAEEGKVTGGEFYLADTPGQSAVE